MTAYQYTARDDAGNEFSSLYTNVDSVEALRQRVGETRIRARPRPAPAGPAAAAQADSPAGRGLVRLPFGGMYSAGLSIASCLETLELADR